MNSQENSVSLVRQLGLVSATALVVSNMIGTLIFGGTGFLVGQLGSVHLVLGIYVVGALCALAGAFCYSELGVNFPSSGGEYVYLTRAYGPTWGFMTGWVSFFAGFSGPIAASALVFSEYLSYFWPALKGSNSQVFLGPFKFGGAQLCASGLVLVFTLLNLFGLKPVAAIQNVLTSTKVAVIVGLILLGLLVGTGDWGHLSQSAVRTTDTPLSAQFAISLFWVYLAYSGWNAATYVAEEIHQPAKVLPVALAAGTAIVAVLYFALNVMFFYSTPPEGLKNQMAIGSITASNLFGPAVSGIFTALMAVGLMSSVNAMVTIGPRVYYAMAKNGAFFKGAAYVSPTYRTPTNAVLWQGMTAMLMTLTPFPDLVLYISALLSFFSTVTVSTLFIFRKRPGWQKLPVVNFLFPVIPGFFMIVGVWMTLFGLTLEPKVTATAIGTVLVGALVYHFYIRKQGAVQ
ncbi:MAG: amino acid permease [Bryobacteraceae bacterium]